MVDIPAIEKLLDFTCCILRPAITAQLISNTKCGKNLAEAPYEAFCTSSFMRKLGTQNVGPSTEPVNYHEELGASELKIVRSDGLERILRYYRRDWWHMALRWGIYGA